MKKVIAILLTLILCLSIIVPASAEENESYVTLDKEIIYLKVGEQAELNISEVNLVYETSVPTGNPNYETWTVTDDEIVSLQLTGGEEGNVAFPDNLVNQTAVITALKTGTTVVKVERGGFGAYAYDECTVVVSDADEDVYMIFDAETDKGCETPTGWGRIGGPVSAKNGWPEAVQGEYSFLVMSSTDKAALYYTLPETLDATKYEYIEFDIYFADNLFADFEVGLCSDVADTVGATWKMKEAWFCPDKWTHVKIPVSAFGNFTETYGGSISNINQVVFKFTKIFDTYELWETGLLVNPLWSDFHLDNVIATTGNAGKDNELIDYDTMMLDPYIEWDILPTPPTPPSITMYGDADNNYCIDAADALCVLQHAVGKVFLGNTTKSDVNGDDVVTAQDALLVLQYSVGKITKFPVEVAHLPDTLMLFDCETSEGCGIYTEQDGNHWGPVSQYGALGHPAPTEGDYSYCINTSGNQMMLNYTFPDSVDLSAYNCIEFDIYSSIEIVCNLNIDIATDTAAINGANWGLNTSWIPGKRWYHVKIPVSAFSEFDGSLTDINRIRFLLTDIYDCEEILENGYLTAPDYTYIYFDNIIATKNGAGKDNELIDFDTMMITPPDWYYDYLDGKVICGGI